MTQILYLPVQLRLLEECAFTANGGSSAQHKSLPYLPGAQLLGALAARLYAQLNSAEAAYLFHSGALRFADARCSVEAEPNTAPNFETNIADGASCVPSPASFQHEKQCAPVQNGFLHGVQDALQNHATSLAQARRLPCLEIDAATGALAKLETFYRVKSAISPTTGASADGMLFGYTALAAGLCLRSRLQARVENPEQRALLELLRKSLQQAGSLRFGKSRSAQYGKAQVVVGQWQSLPPLQAAASQQIVLHLLSDLCAFDQFGQPTLQPQPQELGLPAGRFLPERSFVQAASYSPYNSYLRSQDSERLVMARGSVLSFALDSLPDAQAWQQVLWRIQNGLGAYLEAGLGEVALGLPQIAAWPAERPAPVLAHAAPATPANLPRMPAAAGTDQLIAWLQQQGPRSDEAALQQALGELKQLYCAMKRFHGQAAEIAFGPSRAQWGAVMASAKNDKDGQLDKYLKVLKTKQAWKLALRDEAGQTRSFAGWLRGQFDAHSASSNRAACAWLTRIAQEAMRAEIRGVNA